MLEVFYSLQQVGKICVMGVFNFDVMQLVGVLEVVCKGGLFVWQVLQLEYNFYYCFVFEGVLCDFCVSCDIGVVIYYSLVLGFLIGKYCQLLDLIQSQCGSGIGKYLNLCGMWIIDILVVVVDEQGVKLVEVVLVWLIGCEGVIVLIVSVISVVQVESFVCVVVLSLSVE